KQPRDKNQQADDKNSQNEPERLIGYFELFRFSDRIDLLLMFAGICCTLLYSIAYNVRLVIFARIAASFVVDLFAKQCVVGQHNTLGISSDNIGCQLYVNTDVFDQRDKLCLPGNNTIRPELPSNMSTVYSYVANELNWLLIIGVVEIFSLFIQYSLFGVFGRRQTSNIRIRLFQVLLQRSITYFDVNKHGEFSVKLFANIELLTKVLGIDLAILTESFISFFVTIILSLIIDWQLTLIILSSLPFIMIGTYGFTKLTTREIINELLTYSNAGQIIQEVFGSLRTVLSLNGQNKCEAKITKMKMTVFSWKLIVYK
ncbi:unnamed protein product, partial [Rotaria magnacalcarata]